MMGRRRRATVLEVVRRRMIGVGGREGMVGMGMVVVALGRMRRRRLWVASVVRAGRRGNHPGGRREMLLLLLRRHP